LQSLSGPANDGAGGKAEIDSVLLRHVCALPPPSAVDLLEREDIKFVVLRKRKMNLLGHRGHISFLLE
jgi:hypothetical protein